MAEPAPLPAGARPDPAGHPRDTEMEEAARDLLIFLSPWMKRHKLTMLEFAYLLSVPACHQIQEMCILERRAMAVRKVGDSE